MYTYMFLAVIRTPLIAETTASSITISEKEETMFFLSPIEECHISR